jgi:hypothetical protein
MVPVSLKHAPPVLLKHRVIGRLGGLLKQLPAGRLGGELKQLVAG